MVGLGISEPSTVGKATVIGSNGPLGSLNPTFMHRLVIGPIEVEADEKAAPGAYPLEK